MIRWPWVIHVGVDRDEARKAVEQAARSVRIAESRREVVSDLTQKLTVQGQRNNFIERLNMHVSRGGAR